MKYLLLFLLCLSYSVSAQVNQKSLLWKITSPESEKTSYLYGTMHISGRLAYHLGEEFFNAIESVDAVALESNPIIWLDEIFNSKYANDYLGKFGFQSQTYKGFYQDAFKLERPTNKLLKQYIASDHYLSNWMLYRENKSQLDFEEETFLDLFIYQTGKKQQKNVYSLEDFKATTNLSKMGNLPDPNKKENKAWFEKLTKDKNARDLIEDAYRNKDVMLLDSLHGQINTDNFLKYMLDVRNDLMAAKIDSFIRKKDISLFVGIGAAHLAGEKGVIQFLRNKGYTIEPMTTTITDKAKSIKTVYDQMTTKLDFNNTYQSDLFSVKIPGKMYETPPETNNQRQFFSPELTNGTYFSIKQISTYGLLKGKSAKNYETKIDSLLFESIPGKIISRKKIQKNDFNGVDILNKTANGNYQRYQIYYTPIHVFIFKMGGKNELVKNQSDAFFNAIQLKEIKTDWTTTRSLNNDFSTATPSYYHFKNNDRITSLYNHPELEAFDPKTKSYYLLKRASLHDFGFIETDVYELQRLTAKFLKSNEIDTFSISYLQNSTYPSSITKANNANGDFITLKIIIKGPYYYLLMRTTPTETPIDSFFTAFKFNQLEYQYPFEKYDDSTLLFSVKSNFLYPSAFNDLYSKAYAIKNKNLKKNKTDNSYKSNTESRIYYSENYERVYVEAFKYHDYAHFDKIDSLWAEEKNYYTKTKKLVIQQEASSKDNQQYYMQLSLTDTNSSRMIWVKEILHHGTLYTLKANLDTLSTPSPFIQNFFDSFKPFDTLIGESVLENKADLFFKNIHSKDSLVKAQAITSVKDYITFEDKDFQALKEVISNYLFSEKQMDYKKQLIEEIGKLKNPLIYDYLVSIYEKYEDTASYQLAILRGLTSQNTKKGNDLFLKLLEKDTPLSNNNYEIYSIIFPLFDSLSLASNLYPELLNYSFIKQYKTPIYMLLSSLVTAKKIKPKKYKQNYKQLVREAKIELKEQISYEQYEQGKKPSGYGYESYKNQGNDLLSNYITLLKPFEKKSDVAYFFHKLSLVQDYIVQTNIVLNQIQVKEPVSDSVLTYLAADLINREYLYGQLKGMDKLTYFPKKYNHQNALVESILYQDNFNQETDSMIFIERKWLEMQNDTGYVYFYKSKRKNEDNWVLDYIGLQPLNENEINLDPRFITDGIKIEKYKDLEEIIKEEVASILLEGHKRAKKETTGYDLDWYF
ncbi:hypothetical protein DNU06_12670 [Putridiphycobacter roseus]|uniref:TraB/GumN family protein n=1 Tax=Putridiphycobacter roseus TaxID=2219161 RepID=A0A2W1NP59_9FLAO|nr:TraB/GumN family protein [Putridiphycobacter roseus]PZE16398.1 hypothetical protein DNU06_12670 [Putridiphycobacter roseus]